MKGEVMPDREHELKRAEIREEAQPMDPERLAALRQVFVCGTVCLDRLGDGEASS